MLGVVTATDPAAAGGVVPETKSKNGQPIRTAAFFDLDKTVIAKSSTLAFSKPFFDQGLINRRAVLKSTYAQFLFLMSGADHDQMDRMRNYVTNMCAGWDVEQVKSIVGETLHDIVDPLVFAEAANLIADHKLCGRDVVVVSASGEEIVGPIAKAVGATHAMATRMVVEDGKYTGEVAYYCYGEGKVEAIRRARRPRGLRPRALLRLLRLDHRPADARSGRPPHCGEPRPRAAQRGRRPGLAGAHLLAAGAAARPHPRTIGRRRRHHGRGRPECLVRRRADVLVAPSFRFMNATASLSGSDFT